MGKITQVMTQRAYDISKKIYNKEISYTIGIAKLEEIGLKKNSASAYIFCYDNLMRGTTFTRTINVYSTDYFLKRIYEEVGVKKLKIALDALNNHINYYENKSKTNVISKRKIHEKYTELLKEYEENIYPNEIQDDIYKEGQVKTILVNSYERNLAARAKCIEYYGCKCKVCSIDFEKTYGKIGRDFIHVHHKIEISSIKKEFEINPIEDLIPVCPNCHAMLHKRKPPFTVKELRNSLN